MMANDEDLGGEGARAGRLQWRLSGLSRTPPAFSFLHHAIQFLDHRSCHVPELRDRPPLVIQETADELNDYRGCTDVVTGNLVCQLAASSFLPHV